MYPGRPAWVEIPLIALLLFGAGFALAFRVWGAAAADAVLIVAFLPRVVSGWQSWRQRGSWSDRDVAPLPLPISRSQQIALGVVLVTMLLTCQAVFDRRPTMFILVPGICLGIAWLIWTVRREGWSKKA
jgi:hypothetical protein